MNRTLKLSLICVGIFACGVVVGGVGMKRFGPRSRPPGMGADGFGPNIMNRLASELSLSTAQRAAIEPIIQKTSDELRLLRRESFKQTTALVEAMDVALAAELTPEQREKFAAFKAEQKARMKTLMEERQRRRPEGGSGPGERREHGDDRERRPPEDGAGPPPPQPAPPPPSTTAP